MKKVIFNYAKFDTNASPKEFVLILMNAFIELDISNDEKIGLIQGAMNTFSSVANLLEKRKDFSRGEAIHFFKDCSFEIFQTLLKGGAK